MLNTDSLERILARLPGLIIGVVGDLFLDRYLDIDAGLTERSVETGLDAYQVVRVRANPGAAGTVINNLCAFGVERVDVMSVIGDDGEGYELQQALKAHRVVNMNWLQVVRERRTPTYTKPMLHIKGEMPRELNRLDIKNREPLPATYENGVIEALNRIWPAIDALLVLDQLSEPNCGVITDRVRDHVARLAASDRSKFVLADSRDRIGLFRSVCTKPNADECQLAAGAGNGTTEEAVRALCVQTGRPVFCTQGAAGILLVEPGTTGTKLTHVPAYSVCGPIDIVGAGDSTSPAIACAVASGATLVEAAAFGCLVASITIQQIGTTGTATPAQIRERWRDVGMTSVQAPMTKE
jgi:rfaE bifunctional protein kinase chain/domain